MIYVIPITALCMAAAVGLVLGRRRRGVAILFCIGVLAMVFAFTIWAPQPAEHLDTVALAAVGALVALPGIAGILGGALLGWLIQRHSKAT